METVQSALTLIREGKVGALSTASIKKDSWPYVSMVTYAADTGGSPIFLFSNLADHTQNLKKDFRAGLLIEKASSLKQPQSGPRVTLLGKIRKTTDPNHSARFLARHPKAQVYADFSDFNFYRMTVAELHFVGGFAQAEWFDGKNIIASSSIARRMANCEKDIINHMNSEHREAINLYANVLCKRKGLEWKMIGIDCDGIDLMNDERFARVDFGFRINNPPDVRDELIRLARLARKVS